MLTPTVSADILPVQMYCPLCEVVRREKIRLPLATLPVVVMFFDITVVPSGVVHEMDMSLDLTPSTVSTEHWREYISPAVELPKGFTFTIGGLRSGEQ